MIVVLSPAALALGRLGTRHQRLKIEANDRVAGRNASGQNYTSRIVSVNLGSVRSRNIQLWRLTLPVATASAVGTAQIPAPL